MRDETEAAAAINAAYQWHDVGDRKVNCDICHKYTSLYKMHYAGMVVGTLTVCPDCDKKEQAR